MKLAIGVLVLGTALTACKKKEDAPKAPPKEPVATIDAGAPPEAKPPEVNVATDSEVQPSMANLADIKFSDGPPLLPKGFQIAVIEGSPPFTDPKSFAFLLKFPKGYVIPPHTHAVEERVTVLKGKLHLGDGPKVDKKKTKPLELGGVVAVPGSHTHYGWVEEETIIHVQGVGPFGITYPDPKDDPRKPVPPAETKPASTTDTSMEPVAMNPADLKWVDAPPILPKGAQIAVVEGTPPFTEPKSYIFRLKFPDGYKIPAHIHNSTERVIVTSGTLRFGSGNKWDDASLKDFSVGAVGHIPKAGGHFVQAKGETVVQIQGVGPFDLHYVDPKDDPAKAGSAAAPAP